MRFIQPKKGDMKIPDRRLMSGHHVRTFKKKNIKGNKNKEKIKRKTFRKGLSYFVLRKARVLKLTGNEEKQKTQLKTI